MDVVEFWTRNTGERVVVDNIMLLEGDWTNKEIPDYFEGMQSSFEDQLVTQEMIDNGEEKQENLGKYKIEVKSTGKNLLNTELLDIGIMGQIATKNGQSILLNGIAPQNFTNTGVMKIDLEINNTYTMNISDESFGVWGVIRYNINGSHYYITCDNSSSISFTPLENWQDIIFYYQINDAGTEFNNVNLYAQIEKNYKSSEYEPYKESTNTFYLNSPLLEGDTIEIINGQAYHVHISKKMKIDNSKDIGLDATYSPYNEDFIRFNVPNVDGLKPGKGIRIISTLIPYQYIHYQDSRLISQECLSNHSATEGYLSIIIKKSRLDNNNVEGFHNWLSKNDLTLVYPLLNPVYEPIKADLSVQLFKGITHISNNSNIPSNMEVIVDRATNRAVEAIELAKTNPTVDNLSRARMWINLVKESSLKDELHNQISDITQIEDLKIAKQTVSANMDLYIKSQNALSISLSTNSIIFDEFSGVDDMEKLNAVDITISSSLPYQLNSYLISELQNNDGSKVIPKELFNIRLNGDTDYKAFNNVNEKLILKENCEKGNDNTFSVDLILKGSLMHQADIYKTTLKFEAEQK